MPTCRHAPRHVPCCMSGSLTRGGGENIPGIPGACATRNLTYLARGPWMGVCIPLYHADVINHLYTKHDAGRLISVSQRKFSSLSIWSFIICEVYTNNKHIAICTLTKWGTGWHFTRVFSFFVKKKVKFERAFIEMLSLRSNCPWVCTISDNGLVVR